MIEYHSISHSIEQIALELLQLKLKNPVNSNIFKNDIWHRMGYIVIFNHLVEIPNVVLLVPPIVHANAFFFVLVHGCLKC